MTNSLHSLSEASVTNRMRVAGMVRKAATGLSWHTNGILSHHCPCKSGLELCNHVVCLLIALSRMKEEHFDSSTSGAKYWGSLVCGTAHLGSSRATRVEDLMVERPHLSDLFPGITEQHVRDILEGR